MLKRKNRIKKGEIIDNLFQKGKIIAGRLVFFKVLKNKLSVSRFGIIVGLKISKRAIIRNKIKRQIRSIIHKNLFNIKNGFDILTIAKPGIINEKYTDIQKEIEELFQKAGLFK